MIKGLVGEFVKVICELYELDCLCGWRGVLVFGFGYGL